MGNKIRAEQVGSLLRPQALLDARAAQAAGQLSLSALREIEDKAILDVIAKQQQSGIDILSDGELRRASWLTDMAEAVEGFVSAPITVEWKGPKGGRETSTARAVAAKLHKTRHLTQFELPILQSEARGKFKITLPAPSNFVVTSYMQGKTDQFYPSHADLLRDLVEIISEEVRWLVSQGVTYIQFDAPFYTYYLDPAQRAEMKQHGIDPDREFAAAIEGDNAVMEGVDRSGVTFAMHVCRGNHGGRWYTEGSYDVIAEKLFGSLNVDRFLLEYDDERSGGFEPLRFVPQGKTVVLGLVTTKTGTMESEETLRRRIDEAAKFVPLENLALSPQCGFASVAAFGNPLTMDDQWRKLALVAETARKVWG
jgi:5-methyltetrahydropteroyltriglutamate--homocysteine methyltransferase